MNQNRSKNGNTKAMNKRKYQQPESSTKHHKKWESKDESDQENDQLLQESTMPTTRLSKNEISKNQASSSESEDVSEDYSTSETSDQESEASEESQEIKEIKRQTPNSTNEQNNTIFVGNLAWDAKEQDIIDFFKSCGSILQVRMIIDKKTGRSRGIAYVEFENADNVDSALQKKGRDLLGRPINIDKANSNPASTNISQSDPTPVLFVGNLSYSTTESKLSQAFSKYGTVMLTRIPTGPDHKSKGFGYVQFKSTEHAKAAMEAPRFELDGRKLRLDYDTGTKKKF